jgi:hypothetical protein
VGRRACDADGPQEAQRSDDRIKHPRHGRGVRQRGHQRRAALVRLPTHTGADARTDDAHSNSCSQQCAHVLAYECADAAAVVATVPAALVLSLVCALGEPDECADPDTIKGPNDLSPVACAIQDTDGQSYRHTVGSSNESPDASTDKSADRYADARTNGPSSELQSRKLGILEYVLRVL